VESQPGDLVTDDVLNLADLDMLHSKVIGYDFGFGKSWLPDFAFDLNHDG
jgi:hypothetical protein